MERIPKWARTFASVIPTGPPPAIRTGTDFILASQYDRRTLYVVLPPPNDADQNLACSAP
jgi:hypothetical protein